MPQDGSQNYQYPPGTRGIPDETIESAAYNNFLDDLVDHDLNIARPIHRGGTGATTADQALINLGAEKATQLVTNYDTHVWLPGSFRSTSSATGGPVGGHAFAGIVYINEPFLAPPTNANVTVSARDMDDTVVPGRVYVREKKADVWGAWTVVDASTLPFPPGGGLDATTILEAIQELDADKAAITYVDTQDALKVSKSGDTMSGHLSLPIDPAADQAVRKDYVDLALIAATSPFPALAISGMQINGGMDISQENLTNPVVLGVAIPTHVVDGGLMAIRHAPAGGSVQVGQVAVADIPGFSYAAFMNFITPATGVYTNHHHDFFINIEGSRVAKLQWGTVNAIPITIGFWIRSHVAGMMAVGIKDTYFANRSYVTDVSISAANVWLYKTVVIPGDVAGPWVANRGANQLGMRVCFYLGCINPPGTVSLNTWVSASSSATPNTTGEWQTTAGITYITGVSILPGAHVIPAEQSAQLMRPADQEISLCQRYFYKQVSETPATIFATGLASSATTAIFDVRFPVQMMYPPAIVKEGLSSYLVQGASGVGGIPTVMTGSVATTINNARIDVTAPSLVAGQAVTLQGNGSDIGLAHSARFPQ